MNRVVYVAFLRGINVGGNTLIKMAELKKAFESLRLHNVASVLASGNVVFETSKTDSASLTKRIEEKLRKRLGIQVIVIVRTGSQIVDLIKSDPFKNVKIGRRTKLQVTFLADKVKNFRKLAIKSPSRGFEVVQTSKGEVYSAIDISANAGTPELMKLLEKEYGKKITTRTWNTIQKISKLVGS